MRMKAREEAASFLPGDQRPLTILSHQGIQYGKEQVLLQQEALMLHRK